MVDQGLRQSGVKGYGLGLLGPGLHKNAGLGFRMKICIKTRGEKEGLNFRVCISLLQNILLII